jgi:hypothetical protein
MPLEFAIRLINANKSGYIAAPKLKSMEFKRIVAVTGLPGLFEVVSTKNDGALVRSLEDKSTKFVSSRVHNMSHLESIEVYTNRDNVQLTDVFAAMKESKENLPDLKDNNSVKAYFEKVYPDLDFERVYASDMKKMVKWYSVIDSQGVDFTTKEEAEEVEETEAELPAEEVKEAKATKAPAKKAAAKKSEVKAEGTEAKAADTEEKPKKTTRKKKED